MSGDPYPKIAVLIDKNPLRAPSLVISLATCTKRSLSRTGATAVQATNLALRRRAADGNH